MDSYYEYLRTFSQELGARIVEMYPPLQGPSDLSIPGRCFTKQTGDMVYTMAENSWLSQLWLDA